MTYEKWFDFSCTQSYPFICKVEYAALKGKKTVNLYFTGEQLSFSSFHVWYKYKAASKQLLESWKEKRMTGFRLSWRIENENPPDMTATISEVGRSLQTPGLVDSLVDSVDHKYTAILTIPEDLQQKLGDKSLVIEVDVDMREEDEVNYKLYREEKSWKLAYDHCKKDGSQLVSIHSEEEEAW